MAKKHEALYRRFKADESAQTITGPYRQLHPDDNNERQAVHEHAVAPRPVRAAAEGPGDRRRGTAVAVPRRRGRAVSRGACSPRRSPSRCPAALLPGLASPQAGARASSSPTAPPPPASRSATTRAPSAGSTCPETMGSGLAALRLRQRRLARRVLRERHALAGPARRPDLLGALPQQPRRHLHRRDEGGRASPIEMFAIGVTAADYDNDGWKDLYVTAIGGNHLFRNLGDGTFARRHREVGHEGAGHLRRRARCSSTTTRTGSSTSLVANYVTWSIDKDLFCTLDGKTKSYCTPESYKGESPTLFHNRGDGTFEDVTRKAGPVGPDLEGARRRPHRPRRRRLARLRARERHPAEQALPQQPATAPSPTWARRRGSPSARRASPARAWASTPPTTRAAAGRAC